MSKQIVEIKGIKMEVDSRNATLSRVDQFKVGDKVKLLKKIYSDFQVLPAVIVGFDMFEKLPTINLAYCNTAYGSEGLSFFSFNAQTPDAELLKADDDVELNLNKETVVRMLDRAVATAEIALEKAQFARRTFDKYFGEVAAIAEQAEN